MWDKVLTAFRTTLDKAETTYLTKARSFDCTDEENTLALATLRRRAWLSLRSKVDEQTTDAMLLGKLRGHFEERFRYDEVGVPRVWKPADDIDGAFLKARDEVSTLGFHDTPIIDICLADAGTATPVLCDRAHGPYPGFHPAVGGCG